MSERLEANAQQLARQSENRDRNVDEKDNDEILNSDES